MGQKAGFYIILFQQFINADCSVWTDTHSVSAALPQTALDIADILICQVIWQHSHNDAGKTASMNSAGALCFSAIKSSVRASAMVIPCS